MQRTVTLCDESGTPTGSADLLEAHLGEGKLHIAFSAYVFNMEKNKLMIQCRSKLKMLWPGTWANTCCSHPFDHETAEQAGERRLEEELGFTCTLKRGPSYVYHAADPGGKGSEYEHVTTLLGMAVEDINVKPDHAEVAEWKWVDIGKLLPDLGKNPTSYAAWFSQGLQEVLASEAFQSL